MICVSLASCGANDSSSVSTSVNTTSEEITSTAVTSVKTEVEVNSEETDETTGSQQENQPNETDNSGYPAFDFDTKTVTLNSGYEMPILGIGCFSLSQDEAENSVYWALSDGYRLIDTARIYGNEEAVGRGIQRAIDDGIVTREEIFVTTKMWTSDYDDGEAAVQASLDRLGLD